MLSGGYGLVSAISLVLETFSRWHDGHYCQYWQIYGRRAQLEALFYEILGLETGLVSTDSNVSVMASSTGLAQIILVQLVLVHVTYVP